MTCFVGYKFTVRATTQTRPPIATKTTTIWSVWRENINNIDSSTLYTLLEIRFLTANYHTYKTALKIRLENSFCDYITEIVEKRTKFRFENNQPTNGKRF